MPTTSLQNEVPIFSRSRRVVASEIDFLNHVNNQVYLDWMLEIAWQHSLSVGVNEDLYRSLGKIMVVYQHQMNYHAAAYLDEELDVRTWLDVSPSAIRRKRFYEVIRKTDGIKIFSGHTVWVCMDLTTRKACEIPQEIIAPYLQTGCPDSDSQ